ncbi:hypothetical protein WA158_002765 [Blastocystis sp. Blastoise]
MNEKNFKLAEQYIPKTYVCQGQDAIHRRENLMNDLLSHRKIPEVGWDDQTIEYILSQLSLMDSNNFYGNTGVGEREGRILSGMVARRHFYLAHGIGRAGDVQAYQPKAAGSSLIVQLTRTLAIDYLHFYGLTEIKDCLVLPLATGMSITLVLLTLKKCRPQAKYVIWPRVDQKTCLKAIITAGFIPIVVENILVGDELQTDTETYESLVNSYAPEEVACIMGTTSVFAPKDPDNISFISQLGKEKNIPVVINNAYGLQATSTCKLINKCIQNYRVDAIISSTDKNLMVPVGGALIYSNNKEFINQIQTHYPGRASMSPVLDVFITFLTAGKNQLIELRKQREELYPYMYSKLVETVSSINESILVTPNNPISIGITLDHLPGDITKFGGMLYTRGVSGSRCVGMSGNKVIGGITFENYGSHSNHYPHQYMTAACAIGLNKNDVDVFIERFLKTIKQYKKDELKKELKKKEQTDNTEIIQEQ